MPRFVTFDTPAEKVAVNVDQVRMVGPDEERSRTRIFLGGPSQYIVVEARMEDVLSRLEEEPLP